MDSIDMTAVAKTAIPIAAILLFVVAILLSLLVGRHISQRQVAALESAANALGLRIVEGSWKARQCEALFGNHRFVFQIQVGRRLHIGVFLRLPKVLHFSPRLAAGPSSLEGIGMPRVRGGLALAKDWLDPQEANVLLTPEIVRRLEADKKWTVSRVTLTADRVECSGGSDLFDPQRLRAVLELMVLVAEQGCVLEGG